MKYFTSDWHLNETRIGDFNPFFRPFSSVEEQNRVIIDGINAVVGPADELYHLGDVAMDEDGVAMLDQINCRKRILVIGNYDEDRLDSLGNHFDDMVSGMRLRLGGVECALNHYPTKAEQGMFNVVGHIHGLWKVKPNMVNVGVDAWHFKPVSEHEILFVHNAIINGYYDKNVFPDYQAIGEE